MDDTAKKVLLCGLGISIGLLLMWIIRHLLSHNEQVEQVQMVSSEEDPMLQEISKQRTALISEIMAVFSAVWCPEKDKLFVQSSNTDWNRNIVTIIYENKMARLYCDWEGGIVKATVCFKSDDHEKTHSMRLSVRKGLPQLNKLQTALTKWTAKFDADQLPSTISPAMLLATIQIAGKMAAHSTDEEQLQWLFDYWTSQMPNMEATEDFARPEVSTFVRFTSILQHYWPKQFTEYIAKTISSKQEDPE